MGLETMTVETGDSGQAELFGGSQKRLEPDGLGAEQSEASERASEGLLITATAAGSLSV